MPASTSTAVHAATRFYGRWKATAACSARTRISAARRCRRLRPRGTSGLQPEAEPCPRAAQAYGIGRGCTSETCGQGRGADRCTQAGSRSEGRPGCVCERRSSRADSTPRGIAGRRTIEPTLRLPSDFLRWADMAEIKPGMLDFLFDFVTRLSERQGAGGASASGGGSRTRWVNLKQLL